MQIDLTEKNVSTFLALVFFLINSIYYFSNFMKIKQNVFIFKVFHIFRIGYTEPGKKIESKSVVNWPRNSSFSDFTEIFATFYVDLILTDSILFSQKTKR